MKSKKKRILFAAVDIGYRIEHYSKFIREHYHEQLEAESFSKYVLPKSHYETKYTYTCEIYKKSTFYVYCYITFFFIYALFRYDIFHFLSGETILTRKLRRFELATYKLFGKKVIMHFVGSDIRSENYLNYKNTNIKDFLDKKIVRNKTEKWQDRLIKDANKYSFKIIVSTPDLLNIIPNAIYYPVVVSESFLTKGIRKRKTVDEPITILHSPSGIKKTTLKGSDYIIKTLERIANKEKYKMELILPSTEVKIRETNYSATRYEIFEQLMDVDIVIDQMIIGWYGLLAIESLAKGAEVISYIEDDLLKHTFSDTPIINANINTLEQIIENTIDNILETRKNNSFEISYESKINWLRKNHTIEQNNIVLLSCWDLKTLKL